jgi:hypothetical protein
MNLVAIWCHSHSRVRLGTSRVVLDCLRKVILSAPRRRIVARRDGGSALSQTERRGRPGCEQHDYDQDDGT